MNEISISRASSNAVPLQPVLAAAVRASMPASYAAPGDEKPFVVTAPYVPNQTAIDQAKAALSAAEASLRPIERAAFRLWLTKLSGAVGNAPKSGEDFDVKCNALGLAIHDIPARCFHDQSLALAIKTFKFFPSGAELAEFFEKIARPMRAEVEAIRKISEHRYDGDAPAPKKPPTDEEKAAVATMVAAFKTHQAQKSSVAHKPENLRPRALPLRDEQLLAEYTRYAADERNAADFRRAAEIRVAMLRKKLGIEVRETVDA